MGILEKLSVTTRDDLDIWRLGQLYRVASFIGHAAVLILVSFLYKRFMTGKD